MAYVRKEDTEKVRGLLLSHKYQYTVHVVNAHKMRASGSRSSCERHWLASNNSFPTIGCLKGE